LFGIGRIAANVAVFKKGRRNSVRFEVLIAAIVFRNVRPCISVKVYWSTASIFRVDE
jgi:hypothetical protein